jgi:xanthine phosphoribosyltransferase
MSADRLPHEKGFHVSWDQIHRDARALAWRLDGKGPEEGGAWRRWWASPAAAWCRR